MEAKTLIKRLHEHRDWSNRSLLSAAKNLTDEQLRRELAIGQGSVWKSLLHLYAAEYVWLETIHGNPVACCPGDAPGQLPGNQLGEGGIETHGQLEKEWTQLELRWSRHLAGLNDESLVAPVYRVSTSSDRGKKRATRHYDVLLHVCTHAHYTTAQVINMLRQLGVTDLPDPMLISLARSQHSENS